MGNSYSIKIASFTNYINDVSKETGIGFEVLPRLELGLLDSESKVLTITP